MERRSLAVLALPALLSLCLASPAWAQDDGDIVAPPVAHGQNTNGISAPAPGGQGQSGSDGSSTDGATAAGTVDAGGPTEGVQGTGGQPATVPSPFGSCVTQSTLTVHSVYYGSSQNADGSQVVFQLLQFASQELLVSRTDAQRNVTCVKLGKVGVEWTPIQIGDYTGARDPSATPYVVHDILWRRRNDAALMIMGVNNLLQVQGVSHLGGVGWEWAPVVGAVDLDGDGLADVAMRNANTGAINLYFVKNVPLASDFSRAASSLKAWCKMGATGQANGKATSLLGTNGLVFSGGGGATFYYDISIDPHSPPSSPSCLFKYQTLE